MATIETNSYQAIKDNSGMISLLVKERIWEEIVKGFNQSKNFSNYIQLLYNTGLANNIFTKLKLTPLITDKTVSLEQHFAYLFMENSTTGLLDKMKFEFKMPHDFSRKVIFFLDLIHLTPEKAIDLYKKKVICDADNEEIQEWYDLTGLNTTTHKAFLKYEPSVSAEELMLKGFKNRALGEEIKRLELENFKNIKQKC